MSGFDLATVAIMNWHAQFAWQANLNQGLHETEQRAKRVSAVEQHDVFAAAVLAREWLAGIQGLHAGLFHDLHSKRAITEALEYLQRAAHPRGLDSEISAYFTRMDQLANFRRIAGEDPGRYVEAARVRHAKQGGGKLWLVVPVPLLLLAALAAAGNVRAAIPGIIFLVVLAVPFIVLFFRAANEKARLARELQECEALGAAFSAFVGSPDGYPWLQRMWLTHRMLFESAPSAPVSGRTGGQGAVQQVVERQIVERQIVVIRCKFCRQHTPVDRPSCEHCGAAGFGSAQA